MPIRINLLAEAQALEELRRRDPVKRAVLVGALLVVAVLVWSSSLWLRAVAAKGELNRIEGDLASNTNKFAEARAAQQELQDVRLKLAALRDLATNRFLNGNLLDALQHATVPNVELTHIRVDQSYVLTPESKPKTEGGRTIPAKPATVTEKIGVTLEARDYSQVAGAALPAYKQALTELPYFQKALARTNDIQLRDYSSPKNGGEGRSFITFKLEIAYPEKTR